MARAFLTVVLTVLTLFAAPVWAQEDGGPDYARWESAASQAEALADDPQASDEDLNRTRSEMADWRRQFHDAQGTNANRIKAVEEQLAALGDPPAEGQTEESEVATRRAELNGQLSSLQAPRLTAVEAFSRADSIIEQIARVTAERQATMLARHSPSPLFPGNWLLAGSETVELGRQMGAEFVQNFD